MHIVFSGTRIEMIIVTGGELNTAWSRRNRNEMYFTLETTFDVCKRENNRSEPCEPERVGGSVLPLVRGAAVRACLIALVFVVAMYGFVRTAYAANGDQATAAAASKNPTPVLLRN